MVTLEAVTDERARLAELADKRRELLAEGKRIGARAAASEDAGEIGRLRVERERVDDEAAAALVTARRLAEALADVERLRLVGLVDTEAKQLEAARAFVNENGPVVAALSERVENARLLAMQLDPRAAVLNVTLFDNRGRGEFVAGLMAEFTRGEK